LAKGSKLVPRADLCYFVGYLKGIRGGYFYYPKKQKVLVSTNARYLEDEKSMSTKGSTRVELEEKLVSETNSSDPIEEPKETQPKVSILIEPRHKGRIPRVPERWIGKDFELVSHHQELDPTRYKEAIADADTDKWYEAMKAVIKSMYCN
jgi:hypothetical protein